MYIIEKVDAEVCVECCERYSHAKILGEIDNLLETKYEIK
jgi:hypothetical protein